MHYVPSMATATDLSVPSSDSSTSPGRADLISMFLRVRKSFISFCVVEGTINAFSNMLHVVMIKHRRDLLFIMLEYLPEARNSVAIFLELLGGMSLSPIYLPINL